MQVKVVQLPNGAILADRRGVMVFPDGATISGDFVRWGTEGREVGPGAELLVVDSSEYPPTTAHYHFEFEYTREAGKPAIRTPTIVASEPVVGGRGRGHRE